MHSSIAHLKAQLHRTLEMVNSLNGVTSLCIRIKSFRAFRSSAFWVSAPILVFHKITGWDVWFSYFLFSFPTKIENDIENVFEQ